MIFISWLLPNLIKIAISFFMDDRNEFVIRLQSCNNWGGLVAARNVTNLVNNIAESLNIHSYHILQM